MNHPADDLDLDGLYGDGDEDDTTTLDQSMIDDAEAHEIMDSIAQ